MKTYNKLIKEIRSEFKGKCKLNVKKESWPGDFEFHICVNNHSSRVYLIKDSLVNIRNCNSTSYKELKNILINFIKEEIKQQKID